MRKRMDDEREAPFKHLAFHRGHQNHLPQNTCTGKSLPRWCANSAGTTGNVCPPHGEDFIPNWRLIIRLTRLRRPEALVVGRVQACRREGAKALLDKLSVVCMLLDVSEWRIFMMLPSSMYTPCNKEDEGSGRP